MRSLLSRLAGHLSPGLWRLTAAKARTHLCCAVFAALLAVSAPSATAQPADQHGLTSDMSALLRQQGLTGTVWALADPVHGLRTGAAGLKDAGTGAPMLATQRVHIGSITKTVLALGVLRLASQGRLALDQPLASVLPTVAIDNPWARTDPVRLRHLLDHSAGLDDARLSQVLSLQAMPDAALSRAFQREGGLLRLRFRPGSRSSYSNMGYTLLARVIEAVTAERYEAWLDRELLRPLSLHDSTFGFTTQAPGPHADTRLAMGTSNTAGRSWRSRVGCAQRGSSPPLQSTWGGWRSSCSGTGTSKANAMDAPSSTPRCCARWAGPRAPRLRAQAWPWATRWAWPRATAMACSAAATAATSSATARCSACSTTRGAHSSSPSTPTATARTSTPSTGV